MTLIYPTINLLARPTITPSGLIVSRASAATRIDALGRVARVDSDTLRHDFDPDTGQYRGWLIEEARTNQLPRSDAPGEAPWQTAAASVSAGGATAPDGETSADTLTEDDTTAAHALYQEAVSYAAGTAYSLSVFAKSAGRERIQLVLPSPAFGTVHSAVFDLASGSVTFTEGTVETAVTALPDGWFRCAVTATASTTATTSAYLRLRDTGSVSDYAGDGTSGVHLWGAQLEAGAFASSYIPTGAAAVTRSADRISLPLAGQVFNPREGTLVVTGLCAPGTAATLADLGDGTGDNRLTVALDAGAGDAASVTVVAAGATVADLSRAGVSGTEESRCAAAFAVDDFALVLNGGTPDADTAGAVPVVSTLTVGASGTGTVGPRCWVRQIGVFPRRMADADLQLLTL
jgi:hypothetical protein